MRHELAVRIGAAAAHFGKLRVRQPRVIAVREIVDQRRTGGVRLDRGIRRHAHLGLPFRHLREGLRKPGKHYEGGGLMLSVALRAEIADLKRVLDLQGKLARLDRIEQTRSPLRSVG